MDQKAKSVNVSTPKGSHSEGPFSGIVEEENESTDKLT